MPEIFALKMGKAADVIVNHMCRVKKGESVVIEPHKILDSCLYLKE